MEKVAHGRVDCQTIIINPVILLYWKCGASDASVKCGKLSFGN